LYLQRRCGFEEKWRNWIAHCIFFMCFSILENGTPSNFFCNSRGFRQRDPLSPLILVIVMEALSKMLIAIVDGSFLSCVFVGSRNTSAIHIFHVLFVDDTLIFCKANPNHIHYLCALLLCFEAIFGLKINLAKSK
jgi:hypothetical protein